MNKSCGKCYYFGFLPPSSDVLAWTRETDAVEDARHLNKWRSRYEAVVNTCTVELVVVCHAQTFLGLGQIVMIHRTDDANHL